MTRFIRAKDNTWRNLSSFVRIEDAGGGWVRGFSDGDTEGVLFTYSSFELARAETIPAPLGFFALEFGEDGKLIRSPVVAWWTLDGLVEPIISEGLCSLPVQGPAGSVEDWEGRYWPSVQAFAADQRPEA